MIYEDIYAYLKDELNVMEIDPAMLGRQEIGYILFVLANMQGIKSYNNVGIFVNSEYKGAPENSIIFMPSWSNVDDEGFEKNIPVSKYIGADVFINAERRTALLIGCGGSNIINKLIKIFPLIAPWLFKPIGKKEKDFLKNIKFGDNEINSEVKYWYDKLELANASMLRMLNTIGGNLFSLEIERIDDAIRIANDKIEALRKTIENEIEHLEKARIKKLGLLASGSNKSSVVEEIKMFLNCCKDVRLVEVDGNDLTFEILTDCDIWDEAEAEQVYKNTRSVLYGDIHHKSNNHNITKKALEMLFIKRTYKIKFFGRMSINLLNKSVRNTPYLCPPSGRIYNPHISPSMTCMAQYAHVITQAMEELRLDEVLNYILMAIKSISLLDGYIMHDLVRELEHNKCIEAPDGTMMDLKDLLKEADKELNNENNFV